MKTNTWNWFRDYKQFYIFDWSNVYYYQWSNRDNNRTCCAEGAD